MIDQLDDEQDLREIMMRTEGFERTRTNSGLSYSELTLVEVTLRHLAQRYRGRFPRGSELERRRIDRLFMLGPCP